MTLTLTNMPVPSVAVNHYLWDTMKRMDPSLTKTANYGPKTIPIFPLADTASGKKSWENKSYIVYDRLLTKNRNVFYPVKCEEIKYYLKANERDMLTWSTALQLVLDRMDDSGKDINDWIRNNGGAERFPIYFHHSRVYQLSAGTATEGESLRDFSTRPFYVAEFMIAIDFHYTVTMEDFFIN